MKKTEVLVVCTHQEILNTVVRLVNSNTEMSAIGANTLEQAITTFRSANFDLVLMGAGLEKAEETELEQVIRKVNRKIPMVFHYGGGSGLLFTEIYEALK
ncbi:hypothetical protein [Pedobacter panaciterrae]|uniref:hypothetical protein n=1 Tax=Pedobacter panaciterrae TaxID=363849 RepID=UPI002595168C|nr:hypothetical protein [uncultured Pedobacter sp.]